MSDEWVGLILAGGTGSRIFPMTRAVNKHLLPVYDKPMIYYPLTTLMFGGVRDYIVISTPTATPQFEEMLGDGRQWGVSIRYVVQERPGGIAEGFRLAADSLEGRRVALILGDNIFYGSGLGALLRKRMKEAGDKAAVFTYEVADPSAFGVVTLDERGRPVALDEKPQNPKSRFAVPGLYLYPSDVVDMAAQLSPSARGELEITDVNRAYLELDRLTASPLGRGVAWLDGGASADLFEASQFVKVIEDRTGLKIGCPEEISWRLGFIDDAGLVAAIEAMPACAYRAYLERLIAR